MAGAPVFTRAARVAYEFRQIEQITLYCTAHVHRTRVYYNGWNRLWCTPPPDVPDGREEFRSVMIRRIEIRFVRQVIYTYIDIFIHGVNDCSSATWKSFLCVQCSIKKKKRNDARITETVVIYTVVAKVRCNIALPGPIIIIGIYTRMCADRKSRRGRRLLLRTV